MHFGKFPAEADGRTTYIFTENRLYGVWSDPLGLWRLNDYQGFTLCTLPLYKKTWDAKILLAILCATSIKPVAWAGARRKERRSIGTADDTHRHKLWWKSGGAYDFLSFIHSPLLPFPLPWSGGPGAVIPEFFFVLLCCWWVLEHFGEQMGGFWLRVSSWETFENSCYGHISPSMEGGLPSPPDSLSPPLPRISPLPTIYTTRYYENNRTDKQHVKTIQRSMHRWTE